MLALTFVDMDDDDKIQERDKISVIDSPICTERIL